jgi:DNA-binding MarR family transcriptional regulator
MSATPSTSPRPTYRVGDDGVATWSDRHAEAWIGLLETHKRLTRGLDAELDAKYGLGLSSLELLARLAAAEEHCLRLSALAAEAGLSLSRVSRLSGALEARGLIERKQCGDDARAVEAHLTEAGLALMREAQATHFASVQREFFDHLSGDEVATLAEVFGRFAPRAAESCSADGAEAAAPGR